MIIAASIALVQLESLKTGKPSLIAVAVTAVAVFAQSAVTTVENVTRGLAGSIVDAPQLSAQNAALREKNRALRSENARLREAVAAAPGAQ